MEAFYEEKEKQKQAKYADKVTTAAQAVNLTTALSAVVTVFFAPFMKITSRLHWTMYIAAIVASLLMHLSERKHRLPGLPIFNRYSWIFLQFDRFVAIVVGSYLGYHQFWFFISGRLLVLGVITTVGFIFLFAAENPKLVGFHRGDDGTILSYSFYCLFHCLWHSVAFTVMLVMFAAIERDVTSVVL